MGNSSSKGKKSNSASPKNEDSDNNTNSDNSSKATLKVDFIWGRNDLDRSELQFDVEFELLTGEMLKNGILEVMKQNGIGSETPFWIYSTKSSVKQDATLLSEQNVKNGRCLTVKTKFFFSYF